jgi:hypothetical protein
MVIGAHDGDLAVLHRNLGNRSSRCNLSRGAGPKLIKDLKGGNLGEST